MLRLPDGMRDRIKAAAESNSRSMNSEIIATLEEKYPARSIDIETLGQFLHALTGGEDLEERNRFAEVINNAFAQEGQAWTAKPNWDGTVTFFPFQSKPSDVTQATSASGAAIKTTKTYVRRGAHRSVEDALRVGDVEAAVRALGVEPSDYITVRDAIARAMEQKAATQSKAGTTAETVDE